jgi:hypothetical protein
MVKFQHNGVAFVAFWIATLEATLDVVEPLNEFLPLYGPSIL